MIIKRDIYYPPSDSMRTLHIYLPDDYDFTEERYPVMYLFDGHNMFSDADATYGKCWGMRTFLDHWEKKMIAVGMECSHEGNGRLSEYSPYDLHWQGEYIHGIGEQTYQWIIHDIKPMIDSEYRTWGHREATGLCGSSMGGLMSLYGIMVHNDVFSKAACLSSGVFWHYKRFVQDLERSAVNRDTRIYLGWGEIEAGKAPHNGNPEYATREARATRKFEKMLQDKGADTYLYFQWGGRHCEADWEKQVPIFMQYLWY